MLSSLFSPQIAERSEAKSAKRSFASKPKTGKILRRSFASRILLRYAYLFLAKLYLTTSWSLYREGLKSYLTGRRFKQAISRSQIPVNNIFSRQIVHSISCIHRELHAQFVSHRTFWRSYKRQSISFVHKWQNYLIFSFQKWIEFPPPKKIIDRLFLHLFRIPFNCPLNSFPPSPKLNLTF